MLVPSFSHAPLLPTNAASTTRSFRISRCTEIFHWLTRGGRPPFRSMFEARAPPTELPGISRFPGSYVAEYRPAVLTPGNGCPRTPAPTPLTTASKLMTLKPCPVVEGCEPV